MAAFVNSRWIGNRTIALSETSLQTLSDWSAGLGGVDTTNAFRYGGFFILQLGVLSAVNAATVVGMAHPAVIPYKLVAAHVGAEAAAGSAATAKLQVDRAGAGSWTDLVEADVDIKTDVGTMQPVAVTDGEEDIDYGDEVRLSVTGTGAGAVTGTIATLFCYRL